MKNPIFKLNPIKPPFSYGFSYGFSHVPIIFPMESGLSHHRAKPLPPPFRRAPVQPCRPAGHPSAPPRRLLLGMSGYCYPLVN